MKYIVSTFLIISIISSAHALVINEIMSNPTGDDSGREWIEVYNNTDNDVDISTLTISTKGGSFINITPISSVTIIPKNGYGIIGSTVSGNTKFTQDYPNYNGPLFKSSISLVNTGITSIEIKLNGVSVDTIPSYTAAKEGKTYSLISDVFSEGVPTPGEENKSSVDDGGDATSSPPNGGQTTISQMSAPSSNIVLYLPKDRMVIAGAPSAFTIHSMTEDGKAIDNMFYTWSFGDGGERFGSSTIYRYFYPGRYILEVEGNNGIITGVGRMLIKVVAPEMSVSAVKDGKYGKYIDITNPNPYDLDLSLWKISIDGALFSFPKNTLLASGVTHFPGLSMGFASTTLSSSTIIKILFQNMEEVTRVTQGEIGYNSSTSSSKIISSSTNFLLKDTLQTKVIAKQNQIIKKSSILSNKATTTKPQSITTSSKKDTRIAAFIKSLFGN